MKRLALLVAVAASLAFASVATASISMHGRIVDSAGTGCGYTNSCYAIVLQANAVDFWGNPNNWHVYAYVFVPPGSNGNWSISGLPTSDGPGDWYQEYGRISTPCGYQYTDTFSTGRVGWQQNGYNYDSGTRRLYKSAPNGPLGAAMSATLVPDSPIC